MSDNAILNKLKKKYGRQKLLRYLKELEPHLSQTQKKMNKTYITYTKFGAHFSDGSPPRSASTAPAPGTPGSTIEDVIPPTPAPSRHDRAPLGTLESPTRSDSSGSTEDVSGMDSERWPAFGGMEQEPTVDKFGIMEVYHDAFLDVANWMFGEGNVLEGYSERFQGEYPPKEKMDLLYYGFSEIKNFDKIMLMMLLSKYLKWYDQEYPGAAYDGIGFPVTTAWNYAWDSDWFKTARSEWPPNSSLGASRFGTSDAETTLQSIDSDTLKILQLSPKGKKLLERLNDDNWMAVINPNNPAFYKDIKKELVKYNFALERFMNLKEANQSNSNIAGAFVIEHNKKLYKRVREKIINKVDKKTLGIDFTAAGGDEVTGRKGWENTFKQNGFIAPNDWWKANAGWNELETMKNKRLCRCTLCGCYMYVDKGNPICESMVELEHNIPKSGATQLYTMMFWWVFNVMGKPFKPGDIKYREIVFFSNIGGSFAETSCIFNYCCKLCNQIKSDMQPIEMYFDGTQWDDEFPGKGCFIRPNIKCLKLFRTALRNSFINLFYKQKIVNESDNDCSLSNKVSCAALWGLQFIITYAIDPNDTGINPYMAIFPPDGEIRIDNLIELLQSYVIETSHIPVQSHHALSPLRFKRNSAEACGEWFDKRFGVEDGDDVVSGRAVFFGRRDNAGDPKEWKSFTSLKEKYTEILDLLTFKAFDFKTQHRFTTRVENEAYHHLPFDNTGSSNSRSASPVAGQKRPGEGQGSKASSKKRLGGALSLDSRF